MNLIILILYRKSKFKNNRLKKFKLSKNKIIKSKKRIYKGKCVFSKMKNLFVF